MHDQVAEVLVICDDDAVFIASAPEKRFVGLAREFLRRVEDVQTTCTQPSYDPCVEALIGEETHSRTTREWCAQER